MGDAERQTVTICTESVEAFAEPQFVLEFDGKIYVTVAVIEIDPNDPEMDEDQRVDLSELQAMLNEGQPVRGTIMGPPREAASMAQAESSDDH